MNKSLNKIMLIGHVGRDPEMRYTSQGMAVVNFLLATNEQYGEGEERTEWHRIVAFSKLAEICNQYVVKGRRIFIEGRIQTRKWEDKDGNERQTTEIVAREMILLDTNKDIEVEKTVEENVNDDEIPF